MGRYHHIIKSEKGVIFGDRLFFKDIQRRTAQSAVGQCGIKGLFVDQWTAGGID